MLLAEPVQTVEAVVLTEPFGHAFALQVVLIVLQQLLVAAARNAQQFQFRLGRCLAVGAALGNVLLGAARSLHHLVDGAVAIAGQIALTEDLRQLIEDIAAFVEAQLGIDHHPAHHAGCAIGIMLYVRMFLVGGRRHFFLRFYWFSRIFRIFRIVRSFRIPCCKDNTIFAIFSHDS